MKVKRRSIRKPRIEMLPLIDIVFLLLVFFIYAMLSMAVHHGMPLKLPKSERAEATREDPLSLSILRESGSLEYYLDKERVSQSELHSRLVRYASREKEAGLLIFADKDMTYQQLYRILDELKLCGIEEISLQAWVK